MNTEETTEYLQKALNGIIEDYETMVSILHRSASRETVEKYMADHNLLKGDFNADADDWEDMDDDVLARDSVCGALEDHAMETMNDYPLSIDDSHIWFTLGGPNISANVTGWRVDNSDAFPSVDVMDITLKGRWGGTAVDVEVWQGDALFDQVAEMFEGNLLLKFGIL